MDVEFVDMELKKMETLVLKKHSVCQIEYRKNPTSNPL